MDEIDHVAIRKRAYAIWQQAGYPDGQEEAHWREAERQLSEEAEARTPEIAPTGDVVKPLIP